MSFTRASPLCAGLNVFARMLCQRGTPSATLKLPDPLENACLISREGSSAFSGKFTSNPLGMIARSRSKRIRMFSNSSRETRASTTPYGYGQASRRSAAISSRRLFCIRCKWCGWRNNPSCQWICKDMLLVSRRPGR